VARLNRLLDSNDLDVAEVALELRAQPPLESLVIRMTLSLGLSPVDSTPALEEGVSLLGMDRLRVLLYVWLLEQQKNGEISSQGKGSGWNSEALYLASFLRYLGLDSPSAAILHREMFSFALDPRRGQFAELREMLMRDFLALIPVLDPSLLKIGGVAVPHV
jgi:hypothetical protein